MGAKVRTAFLVMLFSLFANALNARCIDYIDEDGYKAEKCTPEYVSAETMEAFVLQDKQDAGEHAIEKIGKANGLSQFEISALKEESRRQFEKEIQKEQRNKVKSFNDVKLNSGKVKPAEWTK